MDSDFKDFGHLKVKKEYVKVIKMDYEEGWEEYKSKGNILIEKETRDGGVAGYAYNITGIEMRLTPDYLKSTYEFLPLETVIIKVRLYIDNQIEVHKLQCCFQNSEVNSLDGVLKFTFPPIRLVKNLNRGLNIRVGFNTSLFKGKDRRPCTKKLVQCIDCAFTGTRKKLE